MCKDCGKNHSDDYFCMAAFLAAHKKLVDNQVDMPLEFVRVIDKHFWDLF